jgi:hypothetical protein
MRRDSNLYNFYICKNTLNEPENEPESEPEMAQPAIAPLSRPAVTSRPWFGQVVRPAGLDDATWERNKQRMTDEINELAADLMKDDVMLGNLFDELRDAEHMDEEKERTLSDLEIFKKHNFNRTVHPPHPDHWQASIMPPAHLGPEHWVVTMALLDAHIEKQVPDPEPIFAPDCQKRVWTVRFSSMSDAKWKLFEQAMSRAVHEFMTKP